MDQFNDHLIVFMNEYGATVMGFVLEVDFMALFSSNYAIKILIIRFKGLSTKYGVPLLYCGTIK